LQKNFALFDIVISAGLSCGFLPGIYGAKLGSVHFEPPLEDGKKITGRSFARIFLFREQSRNKMNHLTSAKSHISIVDFRLIWRGEMIHFILRQFLTRERFILGASTHA
jgi:hypothetical protein